MARNRTSISKASSVKELGEFWDTHSLADYWDQTQEVEFIVRAKKRHRITVDPDVFSQIEVQARINGLVPETLINLWLAEKLQRAKRSQRAKVA